MVVKRKRSESELSSFSSAFSSPTRPAPQGLDTLAVGQINWGAVSSRSSTPTHLPSRTMKRFRDNRPSETEVHQRTLNLLYSAQQRQHSAETVNETPTDMPDASAIEVPTRHPSNQRSLHSFWALPSSASSLAVSPTRAMTTLSLAPTNYQFCGVGLHSKAEMAMELDSQAS